jgi:hypothetical protein
MNAGENRVTGTCGSVTVDVISGIVEIIFTAEDGTTANTALTEGNSLTFEPTTAELFAPSTNEDTVVVIFNDEEISIPPDETIDLKTDTDGDGVEDVIDKCEDTIIPESVPTSGRLGLNRFALMDNVDNIFDTRQPNDRGPEKIFTTIDTGGCSCEQILDATPGNDFVHRNFGCTKSIIEDSIAGAG